MIAHKKLTIRRNRRSSHPSLRSTKSKNAIEPEESDDSDDDEDSVWQDGSNVFFFAEVSAKSMKLCLKALGNANAHALRHLHPRCSPCIQLHINSHGGDVIAGFALYDIIRQNPVPVETYAVGYVASAATFVLLAGERRYAFENCIFLIHQMKTGFWGKFDELCDEMKNSRQLMDKIRRLYRSRTSLGKDALRQILHKELEMDTQKAIDAKLIHAIVRRTASRD
jgi:ATP-dependent protease ClpP protease subunit